jgi:hypothetical protein
VTPTGHYSDAAPAFDDGGRPELAEDFPHEEICARLDGDEPPAHGDDELQALRAGLIIALVGGHRDGLAARTAALGVLALGLSQRKAALHCGLTPGAVSRAVHRLKRELRRALDNARTCKKANKNAGFVTP